jgi:hypothetical protein
VRFNKLRLILNLIFWLDRTCASAHAASLGLGSDWHLVLNGNFIVDRCIDHMVVNYLNRIILVWLIDIICVFCREDMMLRANREFARFHRLFRGRARRRLNAMLLLIHLLKVFLNSSYYHDFLKPLIEISFVSGLLCQGLQVFCIFCYTRFRKKIFKSNFFIKIMRVNRMFENMY